MKVKGLEIFLIRRMFTKKYLYSNKIKGSEGKKIQENSSKNTTVKMCPGVGLTKPP